MTPLTARKQHPFVDEQLLADLEAIRVRVEDSLKLGRDRQTALKRKDPIRDRLDEIFHDRIGDGFSADKLKEIYVEGKSRYELKTPPGYEDGKDPTVQRYGDLVIWKELIEFAKSKKTSMIFVTDDAKEDWWWKDGDDKLGPRPELRDEFIRETGHECYLYSFDQFVAEAQKHQQKISPDAAQEVKDTAEQKRKLRLELENAVTTIGNPIFEVGPDQFVKLDLRNLSKDMIDSLLRPTKPATGTAITGTASIEGIGPLLTNETVRAFLKKSGMQYRDRQAIEDTSTGSADTLEK